MSQSNYKFENVGIANTGDISGTVTGNSQQTNINENARDLFAAFANFKNTIQGDSTLTPEQREDSVSAVNELEAEARKPESSWNMSKVRNGVSALKTLAAGAEGIHSLYETLHPLLISVFHLH